MNHLCSDDVKEISKDLHRHLVYDRRRFATDVHGLSTINERLNHVSLLPNTIPLNFLLHTKSDNCVLCKNRIIYI